MAEIKEWLRKKMEEAKKSKEDIDVLEMDLPPIPERSRIAVHEEIHMLYNAEIIGGKLIISVSADIHGRSICGNPVKKGQATIEV